jgi:nucleoside 2-deoxyribosyltransferase
MIYLASPYSDPDLVIREQRFHEVCKFAALLTSNGALVFSPIAHSHPIAQYMDKSHKFDFWSRFDLWMLERCEVMMILTLPGWEKSEGIKAEISFAREQGIPIVHLGVAE